MELHLLFQAKSFRKFSLPEVSVYLYIFKSSLSPLLCINPTGFLNMCIFFHLQQMFWSGRQSQGWCWPPKPYNPQRRRWCFSFFVQQLGGLKVALWCDTPANSLFHPNPFIPRWGVAALLPSSPIQFAEGAFLYGMPSWQNIRNGTEHGFLIPWVQLALEQTKSQCPKVCLCLLFDAGSR